jgi:hypothetical protein
MENDHGDSGDVIVPQLDFDEEAVKEFILDHPAKYRFVWTIDIEANSLLLAAQQAGRLLPDILALGFEEHGADIYLDEDRLGKFGPATVQPTPGG